ncbi:hypothetical protein ABN763_16480 [Spongiivirga sp. MCCC 1A20706]|uniref:ATP-grasp domain-containing protein n=1 Tax=Spongiivirga sp. MCCC 1A20706 TaxID=3160963 RepID=UPI00397730A1
MIDITILTQQKYLNPKTVDALTQNILDERSLLQTALEGRDLIVDVVSWDDPTYDYSKTKAIVFRTIWDYFERFEEFNIWLNKVSQQTKLINSKSLIDWNIDKHYLQDLKEKGITIVPTAFVDSGFHRSLSSICDEEKWNDIVIKPAIAGGAFNTYKVLASERAEYEDLFKKLVSERDMLVQPFIGSIQSRGEASLMVLNGKYTHAILKKAKSGDYRVQDDFGGSVHDYEPTEKEIAFAEACFEACEEMPTYGRADILWDKNGNIMLGELEIIEPELWIRNNPQSAEDFADGIVKFL